MPVKARQLIRKMRGGAQAHLIEAEDGHCYVVKFQNNPQHRRILVNELIATCLLRYLQVSAPPYALVEISADFLAAFPDVHLMRGNQRFAVEPGWHYGSRFPGDPRRLVVYDYLPDVQLRHCANLAEFAGCLVFDKWTANVDARQGVFHRARIRAAGTSSETEGMVVQMIDHGFAFDGPYWRWTDAPLQGLYFRSLVYERICSLDDFQPWFDRVRHLPEEVVDQARRQVPEAWLPDGDGEHLDRMLEDLLKRRNRVEILLREAHSTRPQLFPNWK